MQEGPMPKQRSTWPWLLAAAIGGVLALAAIGSYALSDALRRQLVELLGPGAEVADVEVRWSGLVLRGLRMPAPSGWPWGDAARVDWVRIEPDLRSLLG